MANTAPPPDYRDLFAQGSEPKVDAGSSSSAVPSAPPPAAPYQPQPAAPYSPQDQQPPPAPYPSQPYQQPAPYPPQQHQPAAYPPPVAVGGQVPYQGYPAPTYASQNQATTVVINQQQAQQTRVVQQKRDSPNHLLHCIICFFCPWYLCIWLLICCIYGC